MIADADVAINLGGSLVFGILCAVLASGRGRSGVGWFFLGFFFSCIALIILLCIPNLVDEEKRHNQQRKEVRRLREQMKKERQVSDERHIAQRTRLEAHDRALGVDTSPADQQLIDAGMAPPLPGAVEMTSGSQWFYAGDGERQGPIADAELRQLLRLRQLDRDTLVWRQGMDDWVPAREVEELTGDLPE